MNYSVGIDVSKGKSIVAILDTAEKLREKVFEVQHSQYGIEQLQKHLDNYPKDGIPIIMEVTSHYHFHLLFYFRKLVILYALLMPFQSKNSVMKI